nr:disease resistance protein At4g27190-like [Ziziphus jujuba var. spinosa]
MEIITSVAGKLAEYAVEAIWQQFVYLIGYKESTKKLDDELKRLGDKREGVQSLVDHAERNAQVVVPAVVTWLKNVDQAEKNAREFLRNRIGARHVHALNLKLRYSLSKKASKMTQDIIQLLQEGNNYDFNTVAYPAPPNKDYVSTSITGFTGLTSRISVMEDIMQALKNDDINMIGICGAGGIGKTKMVEEVMGRAKAEKLFEEFAMAVVSQTPDEKAIQGQIADKLGLRFYEESVAGRADKLRQRMMKDGKKILVILDDIWEKLDFDKVGLPLGPDNKRCKFIFTTRSEDVCVQMKCQKKVPMPYLAKEEAWKLFRESAGSCVDDPLLHPIAEAVADECAGLPLAIVVVGRALENKVDQNVWADALQQLKKSAPRDITGMHKHVFSRIEFSYNYLESKEAKSCFLLCCLFPEDFKIPIEFLVTYGMGLKLFDDVDTILEARTRVLALVDKLKRSFLLLDTDEEYGVKMHDVVRDFAISIGSKDEPMLVRYDVGLDEWPQKDSYEHYSRISLQFSKNPKFPVDFLQFTNLKLLQLFYTSRRENRKDNIPGNFFQGMKGLAVLALVKNDTPLSLPPSLGVLKNLRSLFLHGCSEIEGLSMIGGLEKLEILSLVGSQIRIFPREVGQLKHLKLLDLCGCGSIQRMERGTLVVVL